MSWQRLSTRLLPFVLSAASLMCGGDGLAPPRASSVTMLSGDGQVGRISEPLADSLVVIVRDAQSAPLSGVPVAWSVAGGGSVSSTGVVSGADGRAAVLRVLGTTAGDVTTTAGVTDLVPIVFTATAVAGPQPQLLLATQPSNTAKNGVPLAQQPVVRVDDGNGEPTAAVTVTATVEGATLGGTTSLKSDSYGEVHFTDLAITGPDGSYNLTFTAPSVVSVRSAPIALTSAAEGGQLVITTQPSSSAENGIAFARQPVVEVQNGNGQAAGAGVPVTAVVTGAALTGTTTVQSDASGSAHFTDLALTGSNGSYPLTFTAPGSTPTTSAPVTLATEAEDAGSWTAPFSWPIVGIHLVLLPNGRVLSIGRTGTPQVWDPASGNFTAVAPPAWLFCAGQTLLADGRVLVAGGHISDGRGLPNITYFSYTDNTWSSGPTMARGRWYPTSTVMGNGDVVITAGTDQDSANVTIPEVWSNGTVRQLAGAPQPLAWYPRAFVTPTGTLFVAGPAVQSRFLTVTGVGSWKNGPKRVFDKERTYGAAVMYDDGKILYAGGGLTTNTAEVIDLNAATPTWSFTTPMAFARRHHNLTVLPTGEVLATGGVGGTTFDDVSKGVHAAEMWNPHTGQWSTMASNAITRGYHGTSLLLPDGRVLNAGSGEGAGAPDERNAELYSPPYLSHGARPVITAAPSEIDYGAQFHVDTPDAAAITHVSLIRLGAVTHAFDENQRFMHLSFTADATGLNVTAPSSSNRAPPGHYMLFILNGQDIPSVAKIVRID